MKKHIRFPHSRFTSVSNKMRDQIHTVAYIKEISESQVIREALAAQLPIELEAMKIPPSQYLSDRPDKRAGEFSGQTHEA